MHHARDPADAAATLQNGYARGLVSTLSWANGSIAIPESTTVMSRPGNDLVYLLRDPGRRGQSLQFYRAGDIRICRNECAHYGVSSWHCSAIQVNDGRVSAEKTNLLMTGSLRRSVYQRLSICLRNWTT